VSDLRKLALSTTLHPKCLSLGQKITMCTNCQFIEIENFRDEGKILMRHTHDTTCSEKILEFYKILEESEQFFILFLKKMENLRRFFHRYSRTGPCLVPLNAPPTSLL
jgi:hypothetical protein